MTTTDPREILERLPSEERLREMEMTGLTTEKEWPALIAAARALREVIAEYEKFADDVQDAIGDYADEDPMDVVDAVLSLRAEFDQTQADLAAERERREAAEQERYPSDWMMCAGCNVRCDPAWMMPSSTDPEAAPLCPTCAARCGYTDKRDDRIAALERENARLREEILHVLHASNPPSDMSGAEVCAFMRQQMEEALRHDD